MDPRRRVVYYDQSARFRISHPVFKKKFGIEEMFRDFKSGYKLEGTNVTGERLVVMVLLIAIAYTTATMQGRKIKLMGIQKYIGRLKEAGRNERRHSSFILVCMVKPGSISSSNAQT